MPLTSTRRDRLTGFLQVLALVTAAFSLTACAAMKETVSADDGNSPAAPDVEPAKPAFAESYTDEQKEVIYQILVGEIAGQRGQIDTSLRSYLEAARATGDPRVAERAVRIGVFARDNAGALEGAKIWLAAEPDNVDAKQVIAALHLRAGEVDEAVSALSDFIDSYQGPPGQAHAIAVDLLARERDRETALEVMRRLVEARPDDKQMLLASGRLALRAGAPARAESVLEKVIADDPDDLSAHLAYVRALQTQGKTEEAIEHLGALAKRSDVDPKVRVAYARLLVDAKRYEDALAEFRQLVEVRPDNDEVRYALALLLLQTKRNDEAREQLLVLRQSESQALKANYYLGQIAEADEDPTGAIDYYRQIDRGQYYLEAQTRIAVLLARDGNLEAAREHLHGLKTRNAREAINLYMVEAELLAQADDKAGAMSVYDRGVDEYPEDSDLLYARAMLAEKMGRIDLLERDLRSIISREPNNAQALNALGYTLADRTDRYEEARELIERALELKPNDYYILDSMGWVLYRLGKPDEALVYLRRAAELSDDAEVAAHLGEVLWVMGDRKGAEEVWSSALNRTPDHEILLEVIKRFNQ